jgi:triacylglycerol lipase
MRIATMIAAAALAAATLGAQASPDVAAQLRQIGPVVDPAGTARIYRPLHARAPYTGAIVTRDLSYGSDARQIMDIFAHVPAAVLPSAPAVAAAAVPAGPRPVLIYVSGGPGNKIEPVPDGDAFYDNIMLWAVTSGMIGINMQRLATPGRDATDAAKDVAVVIGWVQKNIARYGGDPNRVFIWAHSAGNAAVGGYLANSQTHLVKGHGLKGAVLMGATSTILPAAVTAGLAKSDVPLFVAAGEIDLPAAVTLVDALRKELCAATRCPATMIFKDHSHMSAVFSPNTADDSVTAPLLKWMQDVK